MVKAKNNVRKEKTVQSPPCLFPDCDKKPLTRGLCKNHYQIAARVVHDGLISWETLETQGKVLCCTKTGPKPHMRAWFLGKEDA